MVKPKLRRSMRGNSVESLELDPVEVEQAHRMKPGRGRPKGSGVKPKQEGVELMVSQMLQSTSPVFKQGRGRPAGRKTEKKEKEPVEPRRSVRLPDERVSYRAAFEKEGRWEREPTRFSARAIDHKTYTEEELEVDEPPPVSWHSPAATKKWREQWLKEVEEKTAMDGEKNQAKALRKISDRLLDLAKRKEQEKAQLKKDERTARALRGQ